VIRLVTRCGLALVVSLSAAAAEPPDGGKPAPAPEPEVLIPQTARHGGWGGPVMHASTVRDRAAVLVGGRGGWLLDGRLTLGGGGFGLVSQVPAPGAAQPAGQRLDLAMGYGGGWLEYTFSPLRLVHVSVGALVGGGTLSLRFRDGGSYGSGNDGFFVAEPAVLAELNLAKAVRANLGIAYRWLAGVEMKGLSTWDVSGPSAVVAVKFGKF
jgi:hypothetical protein